jgi:glycosyltransferase involved in cell wall biosynthesis
MNPLLSIIIATKNRQKYALSAVDSILSLNDDRIEVVIQDNSDDRNLSAMLEPFMSDKRLVYRYTPPPFSSIDNFNAGVELSKGEYVCLIGDDDGINPEIIDAAVWAKANNVDALVGSINANYRWENTGAPDTLFTKMTGSTLTITAFDGKVAEADLEDSLLKLMKNGCTNYLEFSLPKLYHGLVRRKCLETIYKKTGAYLKGLSPDIYSAISLACNVNKLVTVDYPLTIPGVCGQSTSITEGQLKKHSKKLEDAPHFRDRGNYAWSEQVPRIYCVQTIWADSGFAALREMGRTDLIGQFDKYNLYANILAADRTLKPYLSNELATPGNRFKTMIAYISGPLRKFVVNRAWGRAKKMLKIEQYEIIHDLKDIKVTMNALTAYLKNSKINVIANLDKLKS